MKVIDLAGASNAQAAEWLVDLAGDLQATEDAAVALLSTVMVSSHAWVIIQDNEPIAAFGCAPTSDLSTATVWMLGSERVDEPANATTIRRLSRPCLDQMHTAYTALLNHADVCSDRSRKWLEWCGLHVLRVVPSLGLTGRLPSSFARFHGHL